jgi:hypothetical protein
MVGVTLIIGATNVGTKLSDAERSGLYLPFSEPIITEYSSAFALIFLLPFTFAYFDKLPITAANWYRRIAPYLALSIIFSLAHVGIMVALRMLFWPLILGGSYGFFDDGIGVLLYEYRKDAISFLVYWLFWLFHRQLKEARAGKAVLAEPIALKSGATTILLQAGDFIYAKAAGNYAEVTTSAGTQLARITLNDLMTLLRDKGCEAVRIHRSYIVNKNEIMETAPIAGGDLTIKLRNGESLRASRRYKDGLLN